MSVRALRHVTPHDSICRESLMMTAVVVSMSHRRLTAFAFDLDVPTRQNAPIVLVLQGLDHAVANLNRTR